MCVDIVDPRKLDLVRKLKCHTLNSCIWSFRVAGNFVFADPRILHINLKHAKRHKNVKKDKVQHNKILWVI